MFDCNRRFRVTRSFHLAAIAFAVGIVCAVRARLSYRWLIAIGFIVVCLLLLHAGYLWRSESVTGFNDLVLAIVGTPSAWPYVIFSRYAPLAAIAYAAVLVILVTRFALGHKLPDHVVFFLIAVFAPLFLIGFFVDYLPGRYVVGFFPLFVVAAVAGFKSLLDSRHPMSIESSLPATLIAALGIGVLFVNPQELRANANPQYADFAVLTDSRGVDHKGAAEFVLAQDPGPEDVIIVMDVQQQRFYLDERLDYYMRAIRVTRNSSFIRDGEMLSLYTGNLQIASGEQLAEVFRRDGLGRVFIIGSGEPQNDLDAYGGDGIAETMRNYGVEHVYVGRDGVTRVWEYRPCMKDGIC